MKHIIAACAAVVMAATWVSAQEVKVGVALPYTGISVGWGWTKKPNAMANNYILANRVHDILTAVAYAKARKSTKTIHLIGFRNAGPWVALARGLCGNAVTRTGADLNIRKPPPSPIRKTFRAQNDGYVTHKTGLRHDCIDILITTPGIA